MCRFEIQSAEIIGLSESETLQMEALIFIVSLISIEYESNILSYVSHFTPKHLPVTFNFITPTVLKTS